VGGSHDQGRLPRTTSSARQCGTAYRRHARARELEAAADWDVGDVGAPDLVRSLNRQAPQQIWEYLVSRCRLAGARLRADMKAAIFYQTISGLLYRDVVVLLV